LGVKLNEGEFAKAGQIIIRQRGMHYLAGANVGHGADDTLYALKPGVIRFKSGKKTRFDGTRRFTTTVLVTPKQ